MLAHLNGQVLNTSEVANSLGISVNTAKRYIDFMENAYLIRRVYPIWANLKKRWESFVIQQIAANLPTDTEMYHYRTHNGSEIDLVLNRGASPMASIEIKLSDSPNLSRGNTIAFEDLNTPMNYVITPSSDDYLFKERVRVCSLKAFIANYLPNL